MPQERLRIDPRLGDLAINHRGVFARWPGLGPTAGDLRSLHPVEGREILGERGAGYRFQPSKLGFKACGPGRHVHHGRRWRRGRCLVRGTGDRGLEASQLSLEARHLGRGFVELAQALRLRRPRLVQLLPELAEFACEPAVAAAATVTRALARRVAVPIAASRSR
ncbi:MAG: hypothetical protein FJ038_11350, partial [Chloroflexi bacterium]|nr:hypothetical protein [Chloroflexota bacterium]